MIPRPSISKLDHVTIHVNDLHAARHFYEHILGWSVAEMAEDIKSRGIIWYTLPDGRQVHLFASDVPVMTTRAHFALAVDDVLMWQDYLVQAGYEIVQASVVVYNAQRFFIRDPSNNLLEFVKWD